MIDLRIQRLVLSGLMCGTLSGLLLGCSGTDSIGFPAVETVNLYARLRLNVRSAVMSTVAPYDTLQLIPTAYDVHGNVIPLPGPVMYTPMDTALHVSASGLVTLTNKTATNAMVIASVQDTSMNLTHVDTAFILGTTTVPSAPLATFSIQPTGSDSAILDKNGAFATKTLTVTAFDATGKGIPATALSVHYESPNIAVATIDAQTGAVTAIAPGTVRLTASTTYYGVTKTDTLLFRIGYPDTTTVTTMATSLPDGSYLYNWTISNLVIGVGKTVIFKIPSFIFGASYKLLLAGTSLPIGDRFVNEGVSVVFDDSSVARISALPASYLSANYASNGSGNVSVQIPDSMVVVDSIVPVGKAGAGQYSVKLTNYCTGSGFPCATARAFPIAGTYRFLSATTGAAGILTVVAP